MNISQEADQFSEKMDDVNAMLKNLISKDLILELFCDMFECCPEQKL